MTNGLFPNEQILKKEDKLMCWKTFWNVQTGTLVLTSKVLYFLVWNKKIFEIAIADILSVNCKKGFGTGNENMYVLYKEGDRERKIKIQHSSLMSWASVGNLSRIGPNYFSSWERAINEVRTGFWPRGGDGINDLKKLSRLRDQSVITAEEFAAKKKQLLGI